MFILFVLGAGLAGLWAAVAYRALRRRLQTMNPTRTTEVLSGTTFHEVAHMTAWTVLFIIVVAIQAALTAA